MNVYKGVVDYCDRYMGGIYRIVKTQDNSRTFQPSTIQTIENSMRKNVPFEERNQRMNWRNERLLQLHLHKQSLLEKEQKK